MPDRPVPSVRFVDIAVGDDLRRIALRELGNAALWTDLAVLNELDPPYIALTAGPGVLAYGDKIMVPAAGSAVSANTDPAALYGIDLKVEKRQLPVEDGDFLTISGVHNLSQALTHHIVVDKRELAFHPRFGSYVRTLLGAANGPSAAILAAFYVKSAILEDPRIREVPECTATVAGDQVNVRAVVVPIAGEPVDLRILV